MEYLFICLIGLLAFYLKGVMGTGTTTVIVAFSSLIIDPKTAVVLASFINIFGGLAMLRVDPIRIRLGYWLPIAVSLSVGSVFGAMALKAIHAQIFEIVLGVVFMLVSISFAFSKTTAHGDHTPGPEKASILDQIVGVFSGFCGGFIGVNAPPLVYHFGKALDKRHLRRLLVIIFIPSAMTQTGTFFVNGLLTSQIVLYGLCILPFMALGIFLGNKSFNRVSNVVFKRVLAVFLVFVSIRLIL